MDTSGPASLVAGSPVAVLRRRSGTGTETQGIVYCTAADLSIGIRLAGSPAYYPGEKVTLVDFGGSVPWAAGATYVSQSRDTTYFRRTTGWYRHDPGTSRHFATAIRVTVTSPGKHYLERGIATEVSECGLHIFVPAEPEDPELLVLMPGERDDQPVTLPSLMVAVGYSDNGVDLQTAFHRLDGARSKYVARLLDELSIFAERGRNLIDNR